MNANELEFPKMQGPANYRIRVRGRLAADWSARLEGMSIGTIGDREATEVPCWSADCPIRPL